MDHSVLGLIDEVNEALINPEYFLGIFDDFSKASDTADLEILLNK